MATQSPLRESRWTIWTHMGRGELELGRQNPELSPLSASHPSYLPSSLSHQNLQGHQVPTL